MCFVSVEVVRAVRPGVRGASKRTSIVCRRRRRGEPGWSGPAVVRLRSGGGHGSTGFGSSADEEVAARSCRVPGHTFVTPDVGG